MPKGRDDATVRVWILEDSGSGVAAIPEALTSRIQRRVNAETIGPFDGRARTETTLVVERDVVNQACPIHIIILSPGGEMRFTIPFVILPGPGNLVSV